MRMTPGVAWLMGLLLIGVVGIVDALMYEAKGTGRNGVRHEVFGGA